MKKIKLGRSDASGPVPALDFLPELTEDEENQDVLESEGVRKEKAQPAQPNEEVSFINTLTHEELNNHVQTCLEMSSENKINQKNAFALKLIDCFSFVLEKKKDFSAMACTLDAGTKIYSCRVDALHQQVVKLADEVVVKRADKDDQDGETQAIGKKSTKEQRARKNKFIASKESLTRKMKGKDPRDKYLRFEALPGAILSGARRDASDLSLSLERYTPFWPNWDNYKPLKAEGVVTLPNVKIFREKPQSEPLEILPQSPQPDEHKADMERTFDIDDVFEEDPASQEFDSHVDLPVNDSFNDEDKHIVMDDVEGSVRPGDNEADVVVTAMERLQEEAKAEGAVNKAPTRVEALKILFDLSSEYNYLKTKNCNYWAGPEFWKRPQGLTGSTKDKRKVPNKKNEPAEIVFTPKALEDGLLKLKKGTTTLSDRVVRGWQKKKTTLPPDLGVNLSLFLNLFHVENCGGRSKEPENVQNPTNFVDVTLAQGDEEEITVNFTDPLGSEDAEDSRSSQPDPVDTTFYEPASGQSLDSDPRDPLNSAFYNAGPSHKQPGTIIRVEVSSSGVSDFGESSMVPMPKMINVEPIKYSTRPIRVDMQHLKLAMLDVIKEGIEKDTRVKQMDDDVSTPEVRFRDVLKMLPMLLERRTREDLSTALAFTAVLSLTNEHNLELVKCDDGDFLVRFPDFPAHQVDDRSGDERLF